MTGVRSGWLALACFTAAACSTEPSGSLTLSLDPVAKVTNATTVGLQGSVTRTPPKTTQILVRATGAVGMPVDTVEGGRFNLTVTLNPNASNQISLTASDATGATSQAVSVTVSQDGQAPTVAQATPADTSDNVARTTAIQIKMSEPVIVGSGGGLRLTRQGGTVPGTSSLSADSLTFTYAPSAQLSPNAIYLLTLSGVTDVATNPLAATFSACFVTGVTGATASATAMDETGQLFSNGAPLGSLLPPDLVAARFAREGTLLSGIFRFVGPRAFSNVASNRAAVYFDLDVDQDSTTGYVTYKDTLFKTSPGFDTLTSGTRAEYIVGLEPHSELGDSAYVGKYTMPLEFDVLATFLPGVCGAFMGFVLPFSIIGNDDGKMNALAMALTASSTVFMVDPMPTKGHLKLDLSAPAGAVAGTDWPAAPPRAGRLFRPLIRPAPLK